MTTGIRIGALGVIFLSIVFCVPLTAHGQNALADELIERCPLLGALLLNARAAAFGEEDEFPPEGFQIVAMRALNRRAGIRPTTEPRIYGWSDGTYVRADQFAPNPEACSLDSIVAIGNVEFVVKEDGSTITLKAEEMIIESR